jgi:hypothetical protein
MVARGFGKGPDGDTIEQMLQDAPFTRGLPAPGRGAKALPAREDVMDGEDDGARPRRGGRRG